MTWSRYKLRNSYWILFYLKGIFEREERKNLFHPLVYLSKANYSPGWARPEPNVKNSKSSHVGGRDTYTEITTWLLPWYASVGTESETEKPALEPDTLTWGMVIPSNTFSIVPNTHPVLFRFVGTIFLNNISIIHAILIFVDRLNCHVRIDDMTRMLLEAFSWGPVQWLN